MKLYADRIFYHADVHQNEQGLPFLLLLHGFMGSSEVFRPLLPELKSFCNPVTIDQAGHGSTDTPPDAHLFSAERQSEQVRSVLGRLSFEHLFAYGYSMGGRLLFQLVTRYPGLFRGACFESTHCGIQSGEKRKKRAELDESRARAILDDFESFIDQWLELPLFRNSPAEMKAIYKSVMQKQDPKLMAASLRGFGAGVMPPVCKELQHLPTPLYLVAGEHDTKYTDRMSSIAPMCADCIFQIVEHAGHRVHTDRPEVLIQILKTFIEKHYV